MRLLLLLKSQGQKFAGQAGYFFQQGRWHKFGDDKPAPKHVPVSSHPEAAGKFTPKQHFTDEQWAGLKLPESNVNAKTVNKKIDELKHYSDTGNISAILGMSIGSNYYGKQVAIIANKLLDMYGVAHQVSHGQKAGTHPAVAHKGDTASLTNEPAKAEEKPKATTKPKAKPAPKKEEPKPAAVDLYQFKKGDKVKFNIGYFDDPVVTGKDWSFSYEHNGEVNFGLDVNGVHYNTSLSTSKIKAYVDGGKISKLDQHGNPLSKLKAADELPRLSRFAVRHGFAGP